MALGYCVRQQAALMCYLDDGRLELTSSSPKLCLAHTTLAISGEAHRDGQGYHAARRPVMCRGSGLAVAGFVRFIGGLDGTL
jgi:hypothetical protein